MEFVHMADELKDTTSKTRKQEILSYYLLDENNGEFLQTLLKETFDPNALHHVVLKKKDIPPHGIFSIGEMQEQILKLFKILRNQLSPAKNKETVWKVMGELLPEDQQALMAVINKRLRCGVSLKTINSVVPDLIPVIPIALAKKYDPTKPHLYSNQFFCSDKLDGQRVFAYRSTEGWKKYSRAGDYLGNEITTLSHWDDELEECYGKAGFTFLDGEAYRHGMPFEKITGLVKSNVNVKDATPLEYHIFYAGKTRDLRKSAIENSMNGAMPTTLYEYFKPYKYLQGVKQKVILNDEDKIFELIDKAVSEGYEGVMLRSHDVWYDFKRGNHLLKAKQSDLSGTVEYTDALVEDIEYGEMVVREGGVEAIEELPVALIVSVSGIDHTMKVGSGFSLDDRRAWKEDESIILQHVIEVEFQGWGAKGRMRFPRYLRVRNDL